MSGPAITFENVWKKFRRGQRHDSLRDLIPAMARRVLRRARRGSDELREKEFWAVRDVSFDVQTGGALGIIGPNGAGKSTILKLLTRILKPNLGTCSVRGRVGALIEIAAGFHPDLTGRENVFLQGAIMGMKRAEIRRKFDDIVEFAGVTEFIETQVKRYSSGMNARLGFAIAAHLDPDVLIIDEVLSVGDAGFQARCVARMKELLARGIPLVFVSHNLQAVQELCQEVLLLQRGQVAFQGRPREAIQKYRGMVWAPADTSDPDVTEAGDIRIGGVRILGSEGQPTEWVHTDEAMTVRVLYHARRPVERPHFAVEIHRGDGVYCYGVNSNMDRKDFGVIEGSGYVDLTFPRLLLLPDYYTLSVGILHADATEAHDVHHLAYPFSVASDRRDFGVAYLDHEWTHQPHSNGDSWIGRESSNDSEECHDR